jgi:hypothetical protein
MGNFVLRFTWQPISSTQKRKEKEVVGLARTIHRVKHHVTSTQIFHFELFIGVRPLKIWSKCSPKLRQNTKTPSPPCSGKFIFTKHFCKFILHFKSQTIYIYQKFHERNGFVYFFVYKTVYFFIRPI